MCVCVCVYVCVHECVHLFVTMGKRKKCDIPASQFSACSQLHFLETEMKEILTLIDETIIENVPGMEPMQVT